MRLIDFQEGPPQAPGLPAAGRPAQQTDPRFDADVLCGWREQGARLVQRNWTEFCALLDAAEAELARGRFAQAAVAAQRAAFHAVFWHPGVFVSPRIEELLRRLGAAAARCDAPAPPRRAEPGEGLRVLHVATQVASVGGHVRMMWRWIREAPGARSDVALTRQFGAVPAALTEAVRTAGGEVTQLNQARGSHVEWARALQGRIRLADLVVLHTNSMDIIPFIALGGMASPPPVILLNHSDHMFWLGRNVATSVVNTRRSGQALNLRRRGIAPARNLLLPLCLERIDRVATREEAKRALGLAPDSVLLLSIARGTKYRAFGTRSYPDLLRTTLRRNPSARLTVIGPGGMVDWGGVQRDLPGQVSVLAETPDTAQHLAAADIFLDSFPFPSNTSLFEAGLHGAPLVTYFPFGPGCEVMGADSMGIDRALLRAATQEELDGCLQALIDDPALRDRIGAATRREIETTNFDVPWRAALAEVYRQTLALPRGSAEAPPEERPAFEDIDLFQPFAFGNPDAAERFEDRIALVNELEFKAMALRHRMPAWADLVRRGRLDPTDPRTLVRCLSPEWLSRRVQRRLRDLRHA
ncbi:hypothetical protein PVT71_23085 (plasmid) [Salipiger sp. H15]|uniref:Glycosyl transferase family 1 n=1 Tax=Alloyangia sp. H15 TaxID=3029062 RepID=A0AAU8APT3_9RHOB